MKSNNEDKAIELFLILIWVFSGSDKVELYRYEDPVLGPRSIPTPDWRVGRVKVKADGKLEVNVEQGHVNLSSNGSPAVELGSQLVYVVT